MRMLQGKEIMFIIVIRWTNIKIYFKVHKVTPILNSSSLSIVVCSSTEVVSYRLRLSSDQEFLAYPIQQTEIELRFVWIQEKSA